jgi:hypothetical protein
MKTPYPLSNDYELLWNLIQEGNTLSGWVHFPLDFSRKNPRISEIGIKPNGDFYIGSPGIDNTGMGAITGERSLRDSKESFIADCQAGRLAYIIPDIPS